MSWVRIDDGMPESVKIAPLSDVAFRAYVTGICYAARNLTDGFLPLKIAQDFAYRRKTVMAELCPSLWEPVDGGYQVHDYLHYNPNRESVLAEREARHEQKVSAGRAGGLAKAKQTASRNLADGLAELQQKPSPVPVPLPDPLKGEREILKSTDAELDIEPGDGEFYRQYVRAYEKRKATCPSPIEKAEARRLERDYGTAVCMQLAKDFDWQKHPNYMRSTLENRKNGNSGSANSFVANATAHTNGVVSGVSDVDQRFASLAERRRVRTT